MKLHIDHETIFSYNQPVREAIGEARLRPRDESHQRCVSFQMQVDPQTPLNTIADRFGNQVGCYSVLSPHSRLRISATSVVETGGSPLIPAPPLTFLQRRDFLIPSHYVPCNDDLGTFAREHSPADGAPEEVARALSTAIFERCTYEPGSTDIFTSADEVLAGRRGVCQDFAHLLIALCRCMGLPARYVSGYLHDAAQRPGAIVATHAWAEVFLEGRGWLGLDPTHNCAVGPDYVRVALGRDYTDATPVRGVFQGDARQELEVRVRVRTADELLQTEP